MAIPWTQLDAHDARCICRNLAHLMRHTPDPCPFGKAASDAWAALRVEDGDPDALQRWIEQYMTYDQWQLLYAHCVSTPGKNGRRLNSLENAGKNAGLLT